MEVRHNKNKKLTLKDIKNGDVFRLSVGKCLYILTDKENEEDSPSRVGISLNSGKYISMDKDRDIVLVKGYFQVEEELV